MSIIPLDSYKPEDPRGWFIYASHVFRKTIDVTEERKFNSVLEVVVPQVDKLSEDIKYKIDPFITKDEYETGDYEKLKAALLSSLCERIDMNNKSLNGVLANLGGSLKTGKVTIKAPKSNSDGQEIVGAVLISQGKTNTGEIDITIDGKKTND